MAVTIEQVEEILKEGYKHETNVDADFEAIKVLRERIPYEVCRGIIQAAEHDKIWLCSVEDAIPYLSEDDLIVIRKGGCFIEDDSFAMFV